MVSAGCAQKSARHAKIFPTNACRAQLANSCTQILASLSAQQKMTISMNQMKTTSAWSQDWSADLDIRSHLAAMAARSSLKSVMITTNSIMIKTSAFLSALATYLFPFLQQCYSWWSCQSWARSAIEKARSSPTLLFSSVFLSQSGLLSCSLRLSNTALNLWPTSRVSLWFSTLQQISSFAWSTQSRWRMICPLSTGK